MVTNMKIILLLVLHAAVAEDVAAAGPVFSCAGRSSGYYADVDSGCQKYHMCDVGGRLYSYDCPNRTLFQQRVMICDHWFMVDCSLSESYYSSNLLIGVKDKPFIGDHYREQQRRRKTPVRTTTTTPYPWTRSVTTTSATRNDTRQQVASRVPSNRLQYPSQPLQVQPVLVGVEEFPPRLKPVVIPPEYSNNPFFKRLTTGSPVAPILITDKGHNAVLTSPIPSRKDQENVFDETRREEFVSARSTTPVSQRPTAPTAATTTAATLFSDYEATRFSSPSPLPNRRAHDADEAITTVSPLSPPHNFEPTQGHANQRAIDSPASHGDAFVADRLATKSEALADDLGVTTTLSEDHDEDLSSNTLELRFPDTRHMFYIADNPARHAEMLNTNNETVLTISFPTSSSRHHGAMRFKGARNSIGRRDACPQCHPAFLLPDQCRPCVLIRR